MSKVIMIPCVLKDITTSNHKTNIILQSKNDNQIHTIIIDENIDYLKKRLKEQYYGNTEKNGIYLSRNMTNINIITFGDVWDINQEDWNWYTFEKKDVLNFIK